MKNNYTTDFKIFDMKYRKSTGLVLDVTFQILVSVEGITKAEIKNIRLKKSDNIIPLEELTEDVVISWIRLEINNPLISESIKNLKLKIKRELEDSPRRNLDNRLTETGLPWKSV